MPTHQGDGIQESRRRLVAPSGGALGYGMIFLQSMGGQSASGEEARQDGRGAGDGQAGPLALGFHARMGASFLEGDFELPTQHKPLEDLGRVRRRAGAEQGLGA